MLKPDEEGVNEVIENHRQDKGQGQPGDPIQKDDGAERAANHTDPDDRVLKGAGVGNTDFLVQGLGKDRGIRMAFQKMVKTGRHQPGHLHGHLET